MQGFEKINTEIERLKNRIIKLRGVEPKSGVEERGISKTTRDLASKIISLERKKRYGR
jgi:hypothetical protein